MDFVFAVSNRSVDKAFCMFVASIYIYLLVTTFTWCAFDTEWSFTRFSILVEPHFGMALYTTRRVDAGSSVHRTAEDDKDLLIFSE